MRPASADAGEGDLVNSGPLDGLPKADGDPADHRDAGGARAWAGRGQLPAARLAAVPAAVLGTPIPIVHCEACGEVPVPDDQLPVTLPETCAAPTWRREGVSPLAAADRMGERRRARSAAAPRGATPTPWTPSSTRPGTSSATARRTTSDGPFDVEQVRRWMPVDQYTGGVEHAILHLLYAALLHQGAVRHGHGRLHRAVHAAAEPGPGDHRRRRDVEVPGNLVDLGEQIAEYGVDTVRLTMLFAGPPEDDIDWADVSPSGMAKFLARVHRVAADVTSAPGSTRRPATSGCARSPTGPSTRSPGWSSRSASTSRSRG